MSFFGPSQTLHWGPALLGTCPPDPLKFASSKPLPPGDATDVSESVGDRYLFGWAHHYKGNNVIFVGYFICTLFRSGTGVKN